MIKKPFVFCSPINYQTLEAFCLGHTLPATATNDRGENVIVIKESDCYRLDTFQENGWVRTNRYYKNGVMDESYELGR